MNPTTESRSINGLGVSTPLLEESAQRPSSTDTDRGESKRRRLVGLLRGYFASPVIATLGELDMADRMLAGEFSVADFDFIAQTEMVSTIFRYLLSIGLLTTGKVGEFALTSEGRTAVGRNGAFSLLMSYAEYFQALPSLLSGRDSSPSVNRLRNVRGSGQLHSKKFFPAAFGFFSSNPPTAIIDIGCGDGCFLENAQERWPGLPVFGVDLSEAAVEATRNRLRTSTSSGSIAVTANGHDVEKWSQAVPENIRSSPGLIVSLWFVAHEFSQGVPQRITAFFKALHQAYRHAEVVLGEINNVPAEILAQDHDLSIMPEFLLFHALSRQGVLSWVEWQRILSDIPYTLKGERRFDEVDSGSEAAVPASFLWLLQPK